MLNVLGTLFREFLSICLLKRAPQDLPASYELAGITILAYGCASLIMAHGNMGWPASLVAAVTETAFMCGVSFVLLRISGHPARWLQTVTAMAGTNVILVLFALPLTLWLLNAQSQDMAAEVPSLLFLALVLWNIVILAHIFRHALSVHYVGGMLVALGYFWLSLLLMGWLLPGTEPA